MVDVVPAAPGVVDTSAPDAPEPDAPDEPDPLPELDDVWAIVDGVTSSRAASLAADCTAGLPSVNQNTRNSSSPINVHSTARRSQRGIVSSCTNMPAATASGAGGPPASVTCTMNCRVCGNPLRNGCAARSFTFTYAAEFGSTVSAAGSGSKITLASASMPATSTETGRVPRFEMASDVAADFRPRHVRGCSSASTARNGATSSTPSSTTDPATPLGSSCERTRSPKGTSPDGPSAAMGGRKTTVTVASPPGNSDTRSGITVDH